jgi:hypothetical protein
MMVANYPGTEIVVVRDVRAEGLVVNTDAMGGVEVKADELGTAREAGSSGV